MSASSAWAAGRHFVASRISSSSSACAPGLTRGETTVPLPLTQLEIADSTGLTAPYVNRIFKTLRERGFLKVSKEGCELQQTEKLMKLVEFRPNYLLTDRDALMPAPETAGRPLMVLRPAVAAVICSAFVLIDAGTAPGAPVPAQSISIGFLTAGDRALEPASPMAIDASDLGLQGARLAVEDDATTGRFTGQRFILVAEKAADRAGVAPAVHRLETAGARFIVADLEARAPHRGLGCHLARDQLCSTPARPTIPCATRRVGRPFCMWSPAGPWRRTRWRSTSS